MEKRRNGFWLLAAAALTFPVWACNEGIRLESARYAIAYQSEPIEVAKHFALDIRVCPKPGQRFPCKSFSACDDKATVGF